MARLPIGREHIASIAQDKNNKHRAELQKIANKIERLEREIQTNKIDADSGAFLIIQARRRVGQILTA